MLERLNWKLVPEARTWYFSPDEPTDTYVLDLQLGVERWLESLSYDLGSIAQSNQGTTAENLLARRMLTTREQRVAELVARGSGNREIARALVISERTAESHVEHIRRKLGVRSRAQIAARATRAGLADVTGRATGNDDV